MSVINSVHEFFLLPNKTLRTINMTKKTNFFKLQRILSFFSTYYYYYLQTTLAYITTLTERRHLKLALVEKTQIT